MLLKRANVEIEEFDKIRIKELFEEGFVPIFEKAPAPEKVPATRLEEMTIKELRDYAFLHGIELSRSLRKQEILEILEGIDE